MKKRRMIVVVGCVLIAVSACTMFTLKKVRQYRIEPQISKAQGKEVIHAQVGKVLSVSGKMNTDIDSLKPGTIIEEGTMISELFTGFKAFKIEEGDEIYQRIIDKSYRDNENIHLDDLRYIKILHYNFEHQVQVGEMIVNVAVCEDVINIFKELYEAEYEIQSMYLVDNYWQGDGTATDTASIEVNNTSGFNYREVTGGKSLSNHAYGCAIDINPQQNPYVWKSGGRLRWSHENAAPYIDRSCGDPHVIVKDDICYSVFEKYGFAWGGEWSNPIDYQHFEKKIY